MGEAADELTPKAEMIERQIARTRNRMQRRLWDLEGRTREAISIRRRVAERPWTVLAAAAGLGLLIGLMNPKRRPWRRRGDDLFLAGAGV